MEEKNIGKNTSSGAEKVEAIARGANEAEKKIARTEKQAVRASKKAEKKAAEAKKRAEKAAKKAEKQAEKIVRSEMTAADAAGEERRIAEREKREKLALKAQRREAEEQAREEKMKQREEDRKQREKERERKQREKRREHAPGFGGWLAATIALGTACLALTTVVTVGSMRMNDMLAGETDDYRSALYEMASVSEQMEDNLEKLSVSDGADEQRRLLTEVLVDSALMEGILERFPVDQATATDISAFLNRTNSYARTLLNRLAGGGSLALSERAALQYLHTVNSGLYRELSQLSSHMTDAELRAFLDGEEGTVSDSFGKMGKGTQVKPADGSDAPFAQEGNVGKNRLTDLEEISSSRAEELLGEYFSSSRVRDVKYTGDAVNGEAACYNFTFVQQDGAEAFAQITKRGGKLVFFRSYAPCADKNFDLAACDALAREFLGKLGMDGMEAVWTSEAGNAAEITYVCLHDGARVYSDMVRVSVCEGKGCVTGMDASSYLLNHTHDRTFRAGMSEAAAREKLSSELEVVSSHRAIVPADGKEISAYEFECRSGDAKYIVYLDALTGAEVQVYCVREGEQGRFLR